jgi:hypothetical protein
MQCIKLNQGYKDAYARYIRQFLVTRKNKLSHKFVFRVKNRKVGKELREFSFSEKYIFGRFDAFCTRLRNLLSMFKKINLYSRYSHFNKRILTTIKTIFFQTF